MAINSLYFMNNFNIQFTPLEARNSEHPSFLLSLLCLQSVNRTHNTIIIAIAYIIESNIASPFAFEIPMNEYRYLALNILIINAQNPFTKFIIHQNHYSNHHRNFTID